MFDLDAEQTAVATSRATVLRVLAGAGTGKTTALTGRVVHLVQSGVQAPTESIVAGGLDAAKGAIRQLCEAQAELAAAAAKPVQDTLAQVSTHLHGIPDIAGRQRHNDLAKRHPQRSRGCSHI